MLPRAIVNLILDYKYSLEMHKHHIKLMSQLLQFHWSRLFRDFVYHLIEYNLTSEPG